MRRLLRPFVAFALIAAGAVVAIADTAGAVGTSALSNGIVTMASTHVDGSGGPSGIGSTSQVSIASDGSAIAFTSTVPADQLVTDPVQMGSVADTNGTDDVFVYLKGPSIISLVSWNSDHNATGNGASFDPIFAPLPVPTIGTGLPLGLVFSTKAGDLSVHQDAGAPPTNQTHLFAWTLISDVVGLQLVDHTVNQNTTLSNGTSSDASISMSPTGPVVAYVHSGSDLITAMTGNSSGQVWAYDLTTHKNVLVSHSSDGPKDGGIASADNPMIAGNLPLVVWESNGSDYDPAITPTGSNIWQSLLPPGGLDAPKPSLVSTAANGSANGTGQNHDPVVSLLGNGVAWMSADPLNTTTPYDPEQVGQREHVFYRFQGGSTQMIDTAPASPAAQVVMPGATAMGCNENSNNVGLSGDGTLVAFESGCTNLATGDSNGDTDVFARRMFPSPVAVDLLPDPFPVLVSAADDPGTNDVFGDSTTPSINGGRLCSNNDTECLGNPGVNVNLDGTAIAFTGGPDIAPVPNPMFHAYNGNVFVRYATGLSAHTINVTTSITDQNPQGTSQSPKISSDGAYVGFVSFADDLVPTPADPPDANQKVDANGAGDAFIADIRNTYVITPLTTVTEGTDTEAAILVTRQGPLGGPPGTADVIQYTLGDGMAPATPVPSDITDVGATDATGFEPGDPPGPDDYESTPGTLVFPPGITTASFTVPIGDDAVAEGPEFFHATISPRSGAVKDLLPGPASSGYVLIIDDDGPAQDWHVDIDTEPPANAVVGDHVQAKYTVAVDAGADSLTVNSVTSGATTSGLGSLAFPSPPTTVAPNSESAPATATATVVATPGTPDVHLEISVDGTLGGVNDVNTATTDDIAVGEAVTAALTGGPATVAPGDAFTYTLTLTNSSDTAAQLTGLAGFIAPAGTTAVSPATGSLTVPAGGSVDWTLPVTVNGTAADGDVITEAAPAVQYGMSDISLANRSVAAPANDVSTVAAPGITTSAHKLIDVNGGTLQPGDLVDVTITVTNNGSAAPNDATLTETLSGLSSVTGIKVDGATCAPDCTADATSVTVPLDGLTAAGGEQVVTFTATVGAVPNGTTVSASAVVDFSPATTGTTPTAANVVSATTGQVVPVQDWHVNVTQAPPASAEVGDLLTVKYTISVDTGDDNLILSDFVLSGTGIVTQTLSAPASVSAGTTSGEQTATFRVVGAPGSPVDLQVVATGALGAGPSGIRSSADMPIVSQEAVTATLTGGPASVALSDQITYTLHLTNTSDTAVQLSGLPAGLAVPAGTTGGTAAGSATIAANDSADWTLTVDVDDADADGTVIAESASASYAMSAISLAARPVAAPPAVSSTVAAPVITITAHTLSDQDHGTLDAGDLVDVTLTITNTGTGPATTATVNVVLANLGSPTGIELDAVACGACTGGASVTAPLGALASGASTVLSYTATVAAVASGATVSSSATASFSPATTGTSPTAASVASSTVGTVTDNAPVAVGDTYSTDEDTPLTVPASGVLVNDSDIENDTMVPSVVSDADAHGTVVLAADGGFTYDPDENFHGQATFTYADDDGFKVGNTVTVTITVASVNDVPLVADTTTLSVTDGQPIDIDLTTLASDPDGDTLTFEIVTDPAHGTLDCTPAGACTYTPDDGYSGDDSFQFTADDGTVQGGSVQAAAVSAVGTVNLTVTAAETPTTEPPTTAPGGTGGNGSGNGGNGSGSGELPHTGSDIDLQLLLAFSLVGAGLILLATDRRTQARRRQLARHLSR